MTRSPLHATGTGDEPVRGLWRRRRNRESSGCESGNAELEAETTKLTTEREILRRAAKYFAGETNW